MYTRQRPGIVRALLELNLSLSLFIINSMGYKSLPWGKFWIQYEIELLVNRFKSLY